MTATITETSYVETLAKARDFLNVLNERYFWDELDSVLSAIRDIGDMHEYAKSRPLWMDNWRFLYFESAGESFQEVQDYIENKVKISLSEKISDLTDASLVRILPHLENLKASTAEVLDAAVTVAPMILASSVEDENHLHKVMRARKDNLLKKAIRNNHIDCDSDDPVTDHYDTLKMGVENLPRLRSLLMELMGEEVSSGAGPVRPSGVVLQFSEAHMKQARKASPA